MGALHRGRCCSYVQRLWLAGHQFADDTGRRTLQSVTTLISLEGGGQETFGFWHLHGINQLLRFEREGWSLR